MVDMFYALFMQVLALEGMRRYLVMSNGRLVEFEKQKHCSMLEMNAPHLHPQCRDNVAEASHLTVAEVSHLTESLYCRESSASQPGEGISESQSITLDIPLLSLPTHDTESIV